MRRRRIPLEADTMQPMPLSPTHAAPPWLSNLQGRFIVFDGPDGSGKTTQFQRLVALAQNAGIGVCQVREPGGTAIGEQVRQLLLDPQNHEQVDLRCEMLLFMASRAQLIAQKIAPAQKAGQLVLADRFISSTLAYQGTAGGLPPEDIISVGKVALSNHWPDLVVVFDVDEKSAASRLNPLLDRMERKGANFHRKVRQGYLDQAKNDPKHYQVIDATKDENTVFETLLGVLEERFR